MIPSKIFSFWFASLKLDWDTSLVFRLLRLFEIIFFSWLPDLLIISSERMGVLNSWLRGAEFISFYGCFFSSDFKSFFGWNIFASHWAASLAVSVVLIQELIIAFLAFCLNFSINNLSRRFAWFSTTYVNFLISWGIGPLCRRDCTLWHNLPFYFINT